MLMVRYPVAKIITAPANSTAKYELFTVPSARSYKARKFMIHFPTGSNYTMYVSIYRGEEQVFPKQGTITGDNVLWDFDVELEFDGNSVVYVKITNTDTENQHSIVVYMDGELV